MRAQVTRAFWQLQLGGLLSVDARDVRPSTDARHPLRAGARPLPVDGALTSLPTLRVDNESATPEHESVVARPVGRPGRLSPVQNDGAPPRATPFRQRDRALPGAGRMKAIVVSESRPTDLPGRQGVSSAMAPPCGRAAVPPSRGTQLEERPPWDLLLRGAGRVGKACDTPIPQHRAHACERVYRWASGALG